MKRGLCVKEVMPSQGVSPLRTVGIIAAFTVAIGAAMYPIYFYPKAHVNEYSEYCMLPVMN